jgi:hypothetical protein
VVNYSQSGMYEPGLQITRVDLVLGNEWFLNINNVVDATVCVEVSLDVIEDDHRAISTTSDRKC